MVNDEVASVATPLLFSVPVPREVVPLEKVTLPPGTPEADDTVAVRVTLAPEAALAGAVNVVLVASPVTVKVPLTMATV